MSPDEFASRCAATRDFPTHPRCIRDAGHKTRHRDIDGAEWGKVETPRRIQRRRMKGWRMPEGAVYVGRPTKWGNPFWVGAVLVSRSHLDAGDRVRDRQHAVDLFRGWVEGANHLRTGFGPTSPAAVAFGDLAVLRGRDLVCWCPLDQPCHADVLLRLANDEAASERREEAR